MTETTNGPWVVVGDGPPAGFFASDADLLGLPPDQAAMLRRMEAAERIDRRASGDITSTHRSPLTAERC